jgi:hypothetical protein
MKKLAIAVFLTGILIASFIAGVRVGGEAATFSELTYKGVLATYALDHLERADAAILRITFESDISNAKWAHEQLQAPLYTYSAKMAGMPLATADPKYINRITAYLPVGK